MANDITGLEELASFDVSVEQAREVNKEKTPNKKKYKKRSEDARFWKPNIKNPKKLYEAKVRLVPPGTAFLSNNLLPWAAEQHMHWIKEPEFKLFMAVKCRKTLGEKEKCPICEQNWAVYNAAKARGNKTLMDKMTSRQNKVSFIGNIMVQDDINNPDLNGSVKLWEHTRRMNTILMAPTRNESQEDTSVGTFKKSAKQEQFTPYNLVNGKSFFVIAQEDKNNPQISVSYAESYWEEEFTPLAQSKDEAMAILEQCYDINEFVKDVPSSEDLIRRYQEFNDKLNDLKSAVPGSEAVSMTVPDISGGEPASEVPKGNANEFLAEASAPAETPSPSPAPAVAEPEPPTNASDDSDDDDDDDLPF